MPQRQRCQPINQQGASRVRVALLGRSMRSPRGASSMVALALAMLLTGAGVSAQGTSEPAPPPPDQSLDADTLCDRQSFSTLFRCIPHDLRNMARGESLAWLGAAGGMAAGSALLDDDVDRALRDGDPDLFPAIGDHLGQAGVHFGVPLALYVAARTAGHSETAAFAVTLLRVQIANGVVTRSLKLIPRPRPYQEVARLAQGSFPSGHTSATFATATVIHRRWGWRAGLPAYLLASYVGVTRLHNNHYLSDVTFGAALGIATGLAINQPSRRVGISPIVAPGRAGVVIDINLAGPAVR